MISKVVLSVFLIMTSCLSADKSSKATSDAQTTSKVVVVDIQTFAVAVVDKDVQLVDVRTADEYDKGHIDDAINISISDKDQFIAQFEQLDKEDPVYIYCHSGGRSHRATSILADLGFKKIYDFNGGWKAWSSQ